MTRVYLGQPYSHPDPEVMETRARLGAQVASELLNEGLGVYAPIPAWHEAAKVNDLPKEFEFWREFDLGWLDLCDELYVLCLDGWVTSTGLTAEIDHAVAAGKRIVYLQLAPGGGYVQVDETPATTPPPENVLAEAERVVYGDRARDYGHPRENFARIAALWNAYLVSRPANLYTPLTGAETALMMALVKVARLIETPNHRDSWTDIAGYAGAGARAQGLDA